jgi:hypothetical protein
MRRTVVLLAVMAAVLVMASGVALAVNKVGTNGRDVLLGTAKADNLIGRGGNDVLFGDRRSDNIVGGEGNDPFDRRRLARRCQGQARGWGRQRLNRRYQPACGSGRRRMRGRLRPGVRRQKDQVAPDCERVFVGLGSADALFASIPGSFFRGLPPNPFI